MSALRKAPVALFVSLALTAGPALAQDGGMDEGIVTDIQDTLIDELEGVTIQDVVSAQLPEKGLDLCHISQGAWDTTLGDLMMGDWALTNGVGRATEGTLVYDLTDETITEIDVLRQVGQGIVITGAPLPHTVPLQFYKGEAWPFTVDGGVVFEGQEILYDTFNTMPLDCAAGDLPRLRAQGQIILPEGVGDFDLYLYILSKNEAYGATVMQLIQPNGQTIEIVRFVSMDRNI